MLCEICKINEASTRLKTVIDGELKLCDICYECASKTRNSDVMVGHELDFNSFFGTFLNTGLPPKSNASKCKCCGATFLEIAKTGKVGCGQCYETFFDELYPSIKKIHGKTKHAGKIAGSTSKELRIVNELEKIKADLAIAVANQDFENAVILRDRIKTIEKEG